MGNPSTQEDDLDAFFKVLGAEMSPLKMFQRAVQNDIIHSFKPTSTKEIYEKIGKGICEFCYEFVAEAEMAEHECGHKAFSLLILHRDMENELMAFVFHKERNKDIQEESVKFDVMGRKVREMVICEGQQTDQQSKNQEEDSRLVKVQISLSKKCKKLLQQNKDEYSNEMESKKKGMRNKKRVMFLHHKGKNRTQKKNRRYWEKKIKKSWEEK